MSTARKRQTPYQRRDATGHLDPKYAAGLLLRSGKNGSVDEDVAFLASPRSADPLARALGEVFVAAATTGEDAGLEAFNEGTSEDEGGPFVVTRGRDEFARGSDPSNPEGATREPIPKVSADRQDELEDQEKEQDEVG